MATSGVILFLFVVGHLLGNPQGISRVRSIQRVRRGVENRGRAVAGRGQLLWVVRVVCCSRWGPTSGRDRRDAGELAGTPDRLSAARVDPHDLCARTMRLGGVIIRCT